MPVYEFLCRDCDTRFDDLVKFDEVGMQTCNECRSSDVVKLYSPFSTGRASGEAAASSCGAGACLPGSPMQAARAGGGCCGGGCGGC